ncbi:MAG TPA: hypothetical protein VMS73_06095 [Anaerolineaceae bacterium]|nr:hypothetical protein [Anaerolineaceae bacterium]
MDRAMKEQYDLLSSTDDTTRMGALQTILKLTDQKVDWIYEVWDELFEKLKNENSFQRSIGIMVICNLAKSDTQDRLSDCLDLLLAHTQDESFITSRQCIQNIWKVAATGRQARDKILDLLEKRYRECTNEKHYNLIRADVIQSIRSIYDATKETTLLTKAQMLIIEEEEEKYRKKLMAILNLS